MSAATPFTPRPPLAELPVLPVHQRPKPSSIRTSPADVPKIEAEQPLTPPSTPPKPGHKSTSISTDGIDSRLLTGVSLEVADSYVPELTPDQEKIISVKPKQTTLKLYDGKYQLHEELGHGVWSNVYYASDLPEPTGEDTFPLSPPISPIYRSIPSTKKVLAVKKPCRRDAHRILQKEASILTYLHDGNEASAYVVPFHGFDAAHHSIILDAVPLTLETHARAARKRPLATKTMFDPIIGAEGWAVIAGNLLAGLSFLHDKGCIHGDIKPANILLRPDENGKLGPLFCDFSSSQIVLPNPAEDIEEVSAVTTDYTSPELLESLYKRNKDRAVATFASDIFALAVTLMFAATGESPYACARMDLQKLGMAKEGIPMEYARQGEQASRVMEGHAVEKMLRGGLMKDLKKRLDIEEWKTEARDVIERWRDEGWSRGG